MKGTMLWLANENQEKKKTNPYEKGLLVFIETLPWFIITNISISIRMSITIQNV
jgi:hypothetical protein